MIDSVRSARRSSVPRVLLSLMLVWSLALLGPFHLVSTHMSTQIARLPSIAVDYRPVSTPRERYNASKLALLIEPRPLGLLAPTLLHVMAVAPADWPFLFLGSNDSVAMLNSSRAVRDLLPSGKLVLQQAPEQWGLRDKEHVDRALTSTEFYDGVLPGVEWLFLFGVDSMICANAVSSLDEWLEYDWVGSPWDWNQVGGTGGLSLRRLSAVRRVLFFQARTNNTENEGFFLIHRLRLLPDIRLPEPTEARRFGVENLWYDAPLGYHVAGQFVGSSPVWGSAEQRKLVWRHCPELKMVLDMKLEREKCPEDAPGWQPSPALANPYVDEGGTSSPPPPLPQQTPPLMDGDVVAGEDGGPVLVNVVIVDQDGNVIKGSGSGP